MTVWRERLAEARRQREARGLQRHLRTIRSVDAGRGMLALEDGTPCLDFCSNDYLGLSSHPAVLEGAREAAGRFGAGARASRLVSGNHALLEDLEDALARFKGARSALCFPSGYQANLGLLSTLLHADDAVFVDRLAHACLVDGVRLSPARLRVFPHNDVERLRSLLEGARGAPARWILADGVYSMDGDVAPLPELLALAREHDATLVLDDAHGTGVLGAAGRGTPEHFGLRPEDAEDHLIVVATLSKALGSQGGVVLGPPDLREALLNAARPFVYSTGLSPLAAGAAREALRVVATEPHRVAALARSADAARAFFRDAGLPIGPTQTPIIPLILGEAETVVEASARLRRRGLLLLPIRPPTVPHGTSRLRLTVTTAIAPQDLAAGLRTIAEELSSGAAGGSA